MAGPRNMSPMEAMPGADVDRETPVRESGERERVLDAGDAEREVGEMGKRTIDEAKEVVTETSDETKGVSTEIQERYQEPMDGKENAGLAGVDAKLAVAEQKLEQAVKAEMAAEVAPAEPAEKSAADLQTELIALEREYEGTKKGKDATTTRSKGDIERDMVRIGVAMEAARKAEAAKKQDAAPAVADEGPEITVRDATPEEEAEVLEAAAETPKLALEARMRGIEARIKDEKTTDAEKARLQREMEDATFEWQAAAAAEGKQHEVVRPRDPADIRPEAPKGEAANDNAVASETSADGAGAVEVAVGAAAVVEAAAGGKAVKEKKKGDKKESDEDDGTFDAGAEKAADAEYKSLSKDMSQASKAQLDIAQQRAELIEKMKQEGRDYSDEVGGPLGHGAASVWEKADKFGLTEFAKVAQAFMNATGEMVGGKSGDLKLVEKMDDLAKRKKGHDAKMKGLREKKDELSKRDSKLSADLDSLSKKMSDLAGSSLDSPAWAEARAQQAALKKEQVAIDLEKAAVEEAEQEVKDEGQKLEAEEKKVKAEEEQAAQATDREAIVPPAPVEGKKPPEPPDEGPPEPPAAGTSPESAAPVAPSETKLAA